MTKPGYCCSRHYSRPPAPPPFDLAAHIWEQGDTRTSREYDWVTTDGHYVTIPPGSSTD